MNLLNRSRQYDVRLYQQAGKSPKTIQFARFDEIQENVHLCFYGTEISVINIGDVLGRHVSGYAA